MENDRPVVTFSKVKKALKQAGEQGLGMSELRRLLRESSSKKRGFEEEQFDTSFNIILRDLIGRGQVVWLADTNLVLFEYRELARVGVG